MFKKFIKPVYAHCDIPCGIYEVDSVRHAAETCARMTEKLLELSDTQSDMQKHQNFVRMVAVKERYAQVCKEQLYMLWSDYFKPEHLQKFPDLHDTFWQAAKQCGKVKQTISAEEAAKLVEMVGKVADMFGETKK